MLPWVRSSKSVFISFEGGDGSGKSTQAKRLQSFLREEGFSLSELVHEPGATRYGAELRSLLLGKPKTDEKGQTTFERMNISPMAQVLGFCSARRQLVDEVIKPHLKKSNSILISDRYLDSTIAYQVFGLGLKENQDQVLDVLEIATDGIKPDLTIYLKIGPEEGIRRTVGRIKKGDEPYDFLAPQQTTYLGSNHFDEQDLAFHKTVQDGYEWAISRDPERWFLVDGEEPLDDVFENIKTKVTSFLEARGISKTRQKDKETSTPTLL